MRNFMTKRACGYCCGSCGIVFVLGMLLTGGTLISTLTSIISLATSRGRVAPSLVTEVAYAKADKISKEQLTELMGQVSKTTGIEWNEMSKATLIKKYLSRFPEMRSAEAKEFTSYFNAHDHWDDYYSHRDKCEWRPRDLDSEKDYFTYKYYKNTEDWEKYEQVGRNSWCGGGRYDPERPSTARSGMHRSEMKDFKYMTCEVPVSGDQKRAEDERWSIVRLGPMKGNGDYDWHSFWHYDLIPEMTATLEAGKKVWLTGYFSGAIDEQFKPLNYPPIHHHHFHIVPTPFDVFLNHNIMFQMHGDATWPSELGGFDSWLNYFPSDIAFPVEYPLQLDADLNDVRPHGSDDLIFYLEIALRWTTEAPTKPAALLNFGAPFPLLQDGPMTHWTEHAVNYVPGDQESVFWYTGRIYNSGRILHTIAHSHSHWFDEFYVFAGTPEQLGLNQGVFQVDHNNVLPWIPKNHGFSNDDMKLHILYNAHKNKVKLHCIISGSLTVDEADTQETYDRFPNWHCFDDWTFNKGDHFTLVAFDKPMCKKCAQVKGPFHNHYGIPQHSIFRGIYVNDNHPDQVQHFFTYGHQLGGDQVTAAVPSTHSFEKPLEEDPELGSPDLVLAFQAGLISNTALTGFKQYRDAIRTLSTNIPAFHKFRRNAILDRFCEL
mmetsp:Transcript_6210/g.7387  ORF Transcript_6210/g.7387 Transcript_6210/m.7387 type:complete len:658 (-) Transcript_6210:525-2498(-)